MKHRRRMLMVLAAAIVAIGAGALAKAGHVWSGLERSTVDARFSIRGDRVPDDVVLVGIDKRTVGNETWPISRSHYARGIEQLSRAGAKVVVLDVQITEPGDDKKADSALIDAVRQSKSPVVMTTTEVASDGTTSIFGGGPELKDSRAIPASSNFRADKDGALRHVAYEVEGLQTAAMAAARAKLGRPAGTPGGTQALVDYPGPSGSVPEVSLADVESGKFKADAVRGKVAVIGLTGSVARENGDTHVTPVDKAMPGPEVQAAAITSALHDFPLRTAPAWVTWLAIVLLACAPLALALRFGPFIGVPLGLAVGGLYLVVAQLAFGTGTVLAIVPPMVALVVGMVGAAVVVHASRPAWLDGFLDRLSPARGSNARTHRLRTLLLVSAAISVVTVSVVLEATHALQRVELSTVDTRFSVRGSTGPPPDVVLVGFDDKTFGDLEQQWPFDRKYHAKAIRELKKAGAKVIAYDVQFTEPSENEESDNKLIEAVRGAGNVVLSTTEVGAGGTTGIFGGSEGLKYSRGTPATTNYAADADGRLRRMRFDIEGLQTFPLAAVQVARGKRVTPPSGSSAWIDFAGGGRTVRTYSFSDVINEKLPPDTFKGKIVVVGSIATSLQDYHRTATSGDALMPGAEIQANAIQTVLDGFPLRSSSTWLNLLLLFVLGATAPIAALRLRMLLAIGGGVVVLAAFIVGAQIAFQNGTIVTVVYPILASLAGILFTGAIHGVTVAFEREQARDAFARFVPEAVVDQVLADADGVRLGGVRGEATVMFSDLRGFTSFSETLEPERVIESLNRYLTEMSEAILDHGGTLVAYMGDGIMAVFGAPLKQEDHADRALEAARDMLSRMDGFNGWLREQSLHDGFKMGIGLNSGPVMSGNVGSERRLEYTALGDTTNTAARLEGMTKGTPHQLYISDTTKQTLTRPADDLVAVGEAEVRGRKAKVLLWSLKDAPPAPGEQPAPEATIEA
ncbi:adenylate/guanylate cyclase domain-containing protein [Solirubrobacter ginsenosidimutans]|uniref:Adenylate/guanylate cyclase domain-containing protein n=1 Tax=Solirubrobacter ginsenosidimutans TaxID=490573 RepID=A0A9X3N029_9ACTN|nr:adenylate/guanylate cyclase domain-containing protein [Solirubrobacter ginsenosidimutans]MDA0162368.1 adenylate/guanylate cyclase domain-containing protein [Solirubrobacter ginsenosidimutans]